MTASQSDCVFCKIASGELGTPFVHESENTVAFDDLSPSAKHHVLVIPKQHIASLGELTRNDDSLLGELMQTARDVAKQRGLDESGFRVVTNVGPDAGQTVFHVHFHVLGGEPLGGFGVSR
jgi:histidine triad (HIT) family protein